MTPNDSNRDNIEPIVWLPETIIDAGEGRPPRVPSKGHAEHAMNMLPPLILDASAPPSPTTSPDSTPPG